MGKVYAGLIYHSWSDWSIQIFNNVLPIWVINIFSVLNVLCGILSLQVTQGKWCSSNTAQRILPYFIIAWNIQWPLKSCYVYIILTLILWSIFIKLQAAPHNYLHCRNRIQFYSMSRKLGHNRSKVSMSMEQILAGSSPSIPKSGGCISFYLM